MLILRNGPVFTKPLVESIPPFQFKLVNSDKRVTAFPIFSPDDIPDSLLEFIHQLLNKEVQGGQTYPHCDKLTKDEFTNYWFHSFTAVVLDTTATEIDFSCTNWDQLLLGTFYVKPNYIGRCSDICNGGFLVNPTFRGQKVGYRLGQVYLKWAPLLGYRRSVFNLVFVTNPGSWKIWDRLKFDRMCIIPGAAIEKGHTEPVDAIMFGKDLRNVEPELFDDILD